MARYGYDEGYDEGKSYNDRLNRRSRSQGSDDYDDRYDEDDRYDDDRCDDNDTYDDDDRYDDRYDDDSYDDAIYRTRRNSRRIDDNLQVNLVRGSSRNRRCDGSTLLDELSDFVGESILLTLKPSQLNILGQVFRPIFLANLAEVGEDFILLKDVNIKMSNAPEYIFPTPLMIPINQVVWFSPFDSEKTFPLY